jgi:hypothetical protein
VVLRSLDLELELTFDAAVARAMVVKCPRHHRRVAVRARSRFPNDHRQTPW